MIEQNAATYTKGNFTAQFKNHSVRSARRREVIGYKIEEYSQALMYLCS